VGTDVRHRGRWEYELSPCCHSGAGRPPNADALVAAGRAIKARTNRSHGPRVPSPNCLAGSPAPRVLNLHLEQWIMLPAVLDEIGTLAPSTSGSHEADIDFSIESNTETLVLAPPPALNRWGIILAGGDGTRLRGLTRMISGDDRPKQFCAVV